ncbi:MAG TPA: gliding motility-associated C-terminal domain-containing protein [Chitinophagales bacterium]|nr:gliding motility-associated C-terminal domain-containing protein [Chitinophagales bacterium]
MKLTSTLYKFLAAVAVFIFTSPLMAQTYNDGAMNIKMNVGYSWVESVDDPLTGELNSNEFRWRWWGADNANLDGLGFVGGTTIGTNSSNAGWVLGQDVALLNYTYGTPGITPQPVPQFLALQGEGWEDDCFDCYRSTGTFTWSCDQCDAFTYEGSCPCSQNIFCGCSSEDQHCGPYTISNTINYRVLPPCLSLVSPPTAGNAWVGDFFGNACGSDDIGAEVLATWTPPIPDAIVATANVLCQPGLATLQTGGAVFGGDYHWYDNGTNVLVGTGSQITPFVGVTTTYRVHTFNGACESLSYRTFTVTVGQPNITSVSSVSPTCNGSTDGTITVTASGGNGALQYSNNAGATWQNSNVFANLPAGFYNIYVKDASGCTVIYQGNSVVLTQPNPISIFVNKVDASCNGASSGRIDIFAGGGSGNLSYSINNGGTFQPSSIFANLAAGSYDIVVRDANNCSYPFQGNPVVISQPAQVLATTIVTPASCSNSNNGSIQVNAIGGTSPYNYSLNNGPFFPNATFTAVPAGTHTILVSDVNGCTATATATVGASYVLTASVLSQTDVSCSGGADGTVTLTSTGGQGPFEFSKDNGSTWQPDATFTGLAGGVYTFTVRDANGCSDNVSATVIERPVLTATVASVTTVGCFGASTGAIDINVTGGDGNYTYLWSNTAVTQDLTGVPAGTYSVVVTDGAACTAATGATITQNAELVLSVEHQINVACNGGKTGGLDVTVNGGVPAYSYSWSNAATSEDIYGIDAGVYDLTVNDFSGCSVSASYTITQPAQPLSATTSSVSVSCPGGNDGSVTATGQGGTTPYSYLWNNAQQGGTINGLEAGLYVVIVTDSNDCSVAASVQLTQPAPFVFTDSIAPARCFTSADGGVYLTVTGGTAGYNYAWSNNTANPNLTGVGRGSYFVVVTDANGCTAEEAFVVTSPPALLITVAGNNPDCHGKATGFAVASVGGGAAPYFYVWSTTPAQAGVMGVNLSGDVPYTVTVTDANGCSNTANVTLVDPTQVVVSTNPNNVKCFNGNDGTVVITATGGSGFYQYSLNGVYQPDSILTGLTAGEYTAIAQDSRGCFGSANFTIQQPTAIFVDAGPDQVSIRGQQVALNGTAASPNGIIGYVWTPDVNLSCTACQNTLASPDATTTYYLTAMDADSCSNTDSVTVIVKNVVQVFTPNSFTPNGDGLNDLFEVDILGAKNLDVTLFNRWGEQVYNNPAQHNGIANNGDAWDGTKNGKKLPYDTYVWQIKVTYWNEAAFPAETLSGTVTLVR